MHLQINVTPLFKKCLQTQLLLYMNYKNLVGHKMSAKIQETLILCCGAVVLWIFAILGSISSKCWCWFWHWYLLPSLCCLYCHWPEGQLLKFFQFGVHIKSPEYLPKPRTLLVKLGSTVFVFDLGRYPSLVLINNRLLIFK